MDATELYAVILSHASTTGLPSETPRWHPFYPEDASWVAKSLSAWCMLTSPEYKSLTNSTSPCPDGTDTLPVELFTNGSLAHLWMSAESRNRFRTRKKIIAAIPQLSAHQRSLPALPASMMYPLLASLGLCDNATRITWILDKEWLKLASEITAQTTAVHIIQKTLDVAEHWLVLSDALPDPTVAPAAVGTTQRASLEDLECGMIFCLLACARRHHEFHGVLSALQNPDLTTAAERISRAAEELAYFDTQMQQRLPELFIGEGERCMRAVARIRAMLWKRPPHAEPPAVQLLATLSPNITMPSPELLGACIGRLETSLATAVGDVRSPIRTIGRYVSLFTHNIPAPRVVLLSGATGSGKTHAVTAIAKAYAEAFGAVLPVLRIDAGKLRPTGWAGTNVADVQELMARTLTSPVQRGILLLDEFDKAAPGKPPQLINHENSDRAQQVKALTDLLPVFGGQIEMVTRSSTGAPFECDASRWFIVATGVFESIDGTPTRKALADIGYPAELVDRIELLTHLEAPTHATLTAAITNRLAEEAQRLAQCGLTMTHHEQIAQTLAHTVLTQEIPLRWIFHSIAQVHADAAARMLCAGETETLISAYDDVLPRLQEMVEQAPRRR